MLGAGKMPADGKAAPAQPRQDAKDIQIGGVVAAEQDGAARERLLLGQRRDGGALVHADGTRLDHRLAVQDMHLFGLEQLGVLFHGRGQNRLRFGRQAVMQCQGAFLVFQQQARNVGGQANENVAHRIGQRLAARDLPVQPADLAAMRADGGGTERREQMIDAVQRAAADKGQRAAKLVRQFLQAAQQFARHLDAIGRARQIQQGTVNVQK